MVNLEEQSKELGRGQLALPTPFFRSPYFDSTIAPFFTKLLYQHREVYPSLWYQGLKFVLSFRPPKTVLSVSNLSSTPVQL